MKKLKFFFIIILIHCSSFGKDRTSSEENINAFYDQFNKLKAFEEKYLKNNFIRVEDVAELFDYNKKDILDYNENISIYNFKSNGMITSEIIAITFNKEIIEAQFTFYFRCNRSKNGEGCMELEKKFYSFSKLFHFRFPSRLYLEYYDKSNSRNTVYKINPKYFPMIPSKYFPLLLADKESENTIGNSCGIGGSEPLERSLIWELYSKRKIQAISSILKGYNLIGRLYAAEALLYAGLQGYPLKSEDLLVIDLLEKANYSFFVCSGCTGYATTSTEHLRSIKEFLLKAKKEEIQNFNSYY